MSVRSGSSQMSAQRREKLLNIQKKEQLKGLLVNKFKLKYGDNAEKLITNEVTKFLANDRLTEANLVKLDSKIGKANDKTHKADDILSDHLSQKSGKSKRSQMSRPHTVASGAGSRKSKPARHTAAGGDDIADAMSVRSYASSRMSGATNLSKKSNADAGQAADNQIPDDLMSVQSHTKSSLSNVNEDDEWQAIQNFNIMLHYEEQKQSTLREQERKRLIKEELDRQVREKNKRKKRENEEDKEYEHVQKKHIDLLNEKEKDRMRETQAKINNEKKSRDQQLQEEKIRKRLAEKQEFRQEQEVVARLRAEMEEESRNITEKRVQEKEYLQRMLVENELQKKYQQDEVEKEKLEDIKAQEAYNNMLEQQERDRANEVAERERRAQEFMGKMADTVIKNMDSKQRDEENKIRQYEMEKEQQDRRHDQRSKHKLEEEKRKMREFLAKQVEEKKRKENIEKELNDEQAFMWKKDRENYEQEETRISNKIKSINKDNADFLNRQMGEKEDAKKGKMNMQEYLLNKQLLKDINGQRKAESATGSMRSGGVY
jgi:hypothetical protein